MIELEGAALVLAADAYSDIGKFASFGGEIMPDGIAVLASVDLGLEPVLLEATVGVGDEWIGEMPSGASSKVVAASFFPAGGGILIDPQSNDGDGQEIVITGKRPREHDFDGGGLPTGTGGYTGGSAGTGGGGSTSTGPVATPAEQHAQDCGTEDGAAVQVAKHVMGTLPADVSGPPDPTTTAAGNDWRAVEFGAVIIRNANGTFGALNDMIYSSNQPGYAALPNATGQPVQGLWHSHITRGDLDQQAIDRYPSPGDWSGLARAALQAGAIADPSLWITGPDGVTREFKLSERGYFESLSVDPSKMVNGEGLANKERAQSCG